MAQRTENAKVRALHLASHPSKDRLKHCAQIEALISIMERRCELSAQPGRVTLLDLGAGKASFGSLLHGSLARDTSLLLLDIERNLAL